MLNVWRPEVKRIARLCVPLMASVALFASPAQAQFSDGYKFLEAIKKKEAEKVEKALGEPGSTVLNTRDVSTGRGALHIVTERRDITWLRYLVQKGANVNIRDDRGITPLQIATNLGWMDGVEYLVEQKADVDGSNNSGETPLIDAVHRGNTQMMRLLLEGGADPDRADNSGRSARDYAKLPGKSAQVLTTIDTYTKPRAAKAKTIYGPTF